MRRIAVDIGGTFTDIVLIDDETAEIVADKVRSTPSDIGRAERDPEAVRLDVVRCYVSLERALIDYGVALTPELVVDAKATEETRARLRHCP
ncbi:MAG: hydantoinase/oxoprolinase N-terminal domain-containing protein [Syntrophorhabdales bacterium]